MNADESLADNEYLWPSPTLQDNNWIIRQVQMMHYSECNIQISCADVQYLDMTWTN